MPKSQRRKSKRTIHNKPRVLPAAAVAASPSPVVTPHPVVSGAASPKPAAPPRPAMALAPSHPYHLMADLKRIGLLTGIALVILIVLYFILT